MNDLIDLTLFRSPLRSCRPLRHIRH